MNSTTLSLALIIFPMIMGITIAVPNAFAQSSYPSAFAQDSYPPQNIQTADMSSSNMSMTSINAMSTDGSTKVTISLTPVIPTSGQPLSISLAFEDTNGNPIKHQNYAIDVTQNGGSVLSNESGHTHTGNDNQVTNSLTSASPVDIRITLNGVGLPGTDPSTWSGPKGDVVNFQVVPEFGAIATIVLVIAIIGIVITSRIRSFPKL